MGFLNKDKKESEKKIEKKTDAVKKSNPEEEENILGNFKLVTPDQFLNIKIDHLGDYMTDMANGFKDLNEGFKELNEKLEKAMED